MIERGRCVGYICVGSKDILPIGANIHLSVAMRVICYSSPPLTYFLRPNAAKNRLEVVTQQARVISRKLLNCYFNFEERTHNHLFFFSHFFFYLLPAPTPLAPHIQIILLFLPPYYSQPSATIILPCPTYIHNQMIMTIHRYQQRVKQEWPRLIVAFVSLYGIYYAANTIRTTTDLFKALGAFTRNAPSCPSSTYSQTRNTNSVCFILKLLTYALSFHYYSYYTLTPDNPRRSANKPVITITNNVRVSTNNV